MPPGHYISKEKKAELEAELKHLTTVRRQEIATALEYAKSLGDLSENAEYQEARETQAQVEDRIATIERILKDATLVSEQHGGMADLGSTVVLQKIGSQETVRYQIVGSEEANIHEHKISNESPMGAAVLGKRKGDAFSVRTPRGKTEYLIVDIA